MLVVSSPVVQKDLTPVVTKPPSVVVPEVTVMAMKAVPEQPTVPFCPVAVEEAVLSLYMAAVMCVWAAYTVQLASSSPVGVPEAVSKPEPGPEVVLEPPIFQVSPAMAKRAVYTYVLAILCAWTMHTSSLTMDKSASQSLLRTQRPSQSSMFSQS